MKLSLRNLTTVMIFFLVLYAPASWAQTSSFKMREAIQHKNSADRYLREGKSELAITEYQKALALNPALQATYFNLAIAFYSENNVDDAMTALEALLKLNPVDLEAQYNLACLKLYRQKIDDAKLHFEKARLLCPLDSAFLPWIQQGLDFIADLKKADQPTQALALFLSQLEQGLTPAPLVL